MSSRDLSLIDLFAPSRDDVEDFASYVSFDAADCFEFGMALGYSARHVFSGLWIQSQPSNCNDMKRAVGGTVAALDLSRICVSPVARLSHLSFEGDRAFPTQC